MATGLIEMLAAALGLAGSLLLALRRSGEPYELRPTEIYKETLLSSGAITNRIDKVEKKGWVKRYDSPDDRRGVPEYYRAGSRARRKGGCCKIRDSDRYEAENGRDTGPC